jgi:N-dimethylarginine dimethylaminohydrolase
MHEATLREDQPRPAPGRPVGEAAARPARVVVHDPSATGALELLRGIPDEQLEDRTLFVSRPDAAAFAAQHAALVEAILDAGVEVVRLAGLVGESEVWNHVRTNPNQVYTRDSVITLPWLPGWYVAGAMRAPMRRPEVEVTAAALRALGLRELFAAPPGCFLEGGDVIPLVRDGRRALLVGFGPRTDRRSIDLLCERLMPWALDEVIGVHLPEWRMNLDGVLVPVSDDVAVAHPDSILGGFVSDADGQRPVDVLRLLREQGTTVIEVTREESMGMQACNCLCLGRRRIVVYDLCARVVRALRERGLDVTTVPGSELIKGTGGPRCMTRPIYA